MWENKKPRGSSKGGQAVGLDGIWKNPLLFSLKIIV